MNIEKTEEQFRKQFDELGLKPPKDSMPNLERELIIDFWRKALTQTRIDTLKEVEEWVKENSDRVKVPELGDIEPVDYIASETLLTHIQSLLDKKE